MKVGAWHDGSIKQADATTNAWEERYRTGEMRWDKGIAPPCLVEFLRAHWEWPRGTVAVPGCGTGHDVLAFANAGFTAVGLEIAPSAVKLANTRLANLGGRACAILSDFLQDAPPRRFDYLWEHTLFCAIDPAERPAYVEAVLRFLKPGGTYLALNYIICEPDGPPFPVSRAELRDHFGRHFEIIDQWMPRSYPNRCGRELMTWWRRKRHSGDGTGGCGINS